MKKNELLELNEKLKKLVTKKNKIIKQQADSIQMLQKIVDRYSVDVILLQNYITKIKQKNKNNEFNYLENVKKAALAGEQG